MRIDCTHGFFTFTETSVGEISKFMSLYQGLDIVRDRDIYTFNHLKNAPIYSLKGLKYIDSPAIVTITGKPGDVMRANKLIYNFQTDLIAPIATVTQTVELIEASNYFLSPGLILPGSLTERGSRVTEYAAWYSFAKGEFRYSEVKLD